MISADVLVPLVRPYVSSFRSEGDTSASVVGVMTLARESGVTVRTIKALLAGELLEVPFDIADRLVAALPCGPFAWFFDGPLAPFYPAPSEFAEAEAQLVIEGVAA